MVGIRSLPEMVEQLNICLKKAEQYNTQASEAMQAESPELARQLLERSNRYVDKANTLLWVLNREREFPYEQADKILQQPTGTSSSETNAG